MSVVYVPGMSRTLTEAEARADLQAHLARLSERNPLCEFVLSDTGLTLYWRCADGFDYGLYSYTLDGRVEVVWDGNTSYIWRRWWPDADGSAQIVSDPDRPIMPAEPEAFKETYLV